MESGSVGSSRDRWTAIENSCCARGMPRLHLLFARLFVVLSQQLMVNILPSDLVAFAWCLPCLLDGIVLIPLCASILER
jgi:hypothetical protein